MAYQPSEQGIDISDWIRAKRLERIYYQKKCRGKLCLQEEVGTHLSLQTFANRNLRMSGISSNKFWVWQECHSNHRSSAASAKQKKPKQRRKDLMNQLIIRCWSLPPVQQNLYPVSRYHSAPQAVLRRAAERIGMPGQGIQRNTLSSQEGDSTGVCFRILKIYNGNTLPMWRLVEW